MSGGSYNYLFCADPDQLLARRDDLRRMAASLTERGFKDAALDTERLIVLIDHAERQIAAHAERLAKVWKAVEWMESGDSGRAAIEAAVAEYRGGGQGTQ